MGCVASGPGGNCFEVSLRRAAAIGACGDSTGVALLERFGRKAGLGLAGCGVLGLAPESVALWVRGFLEVVGRVRFAFINATSPGVEA